MFQCFNILIEFIAGVFTVSMKRRKIIFKIVKIISEILILNFKTSINYKHLHVYSYMQFIMNTYCWLELLIGPYCSAYLNWFIELSLASINIKELTLLLVCTCCTDGCTYCMVGCTCCTDGCTCCTDGCITYAAGGAP